MYEKHFSFKYKPFELVPNPDLLFLSSTHKKAITCLDYGLKEKVGFILLTGEIGSGKTTIIRNFIKDLNGSVKLSKIHNTKISSEQLISMVNEDFGLEIEGKNKIRLLSELNVFLIEQYSKNYQPILLIDEAQNLSPDLLEEIRLLSNLETDNAKLLQIILVGQPELKKLLMLPELVQLRQRININYHIAPLTIDETAQYIKHRLTVAGNPEAIKVQGDMLPLVYQFSKGIPRLINILCDFALLTAFVAGKEEVTADIVREVVKDLKSNDSWNEGDTSSSQEVRKNERTDFSKTVGDISLRLFKLEEIVTSCIQEIFSLKEKMVQLDGNMSNLSAAQNENRINELSERISMLDKMSADINPEKKNKLPQTEKQQSKVLHKLSEQIGILTDTISRLNDKIKNQ